MHEACCFPCRLKKIQEKKKRQKLIQEEETILRLAALRERGGGGGRWNDACGSSFNLRLHVHMLSEMFIVFTPQLCTAMRCCTMKCCCHSLLSNLALDHPAKAKVIFDDLVDEDIVV